MYYKPKKQNRNKNKLLKHKMVYIVPKKITPTTHFLKGKTLKLFQL